MLPQRQTPPDKVCINNIRVTIHPSMYQYMGSPCTVMWQTLGNDLIIIPDKDNLEIVPYRSMYTMRRRHLGRFRNGEFRFALTHHFGLPTVTILNCLTKRVLTYGIIKGAGRGRKRRNGPVE